MEVIETLLDDVYRLGLGVSRRHTLKRVGQFSTDELPDDHEQRDEAVYTAELLYLGGRLADRAFQNLPQKFRRYAEEWSSMQIDEQVRILGELMDRLHPSRWRQVRSSERPFLRDQEILDREGPFPAQTKSWARGPSMPNCLGMAHMLVGFARAAGAKHRLVTPIVPSWYSAMVLQRRQVAYNLRQLDTFPDKPYVRGMRRDLKRLDRQTLMAMSMAAREAAHHALAIELADGSYRLVDPYMGIFDMIHVDDNNESLSALWRVHSRRQQRVQFDFPSLERLAADCVIGKKMRSRLGKVIAITHKHGWSLQTKRRKDLFYREVLMAIMEYCSIFVSDAVSQRPMVYEDSNAALSLAAFTVNHRAMTTGMQCASIAIEAPHQHIIRDNMGAFKDDPSIPTLPLPGMSEAEYLPELRPYLINEQGDTNESESTSA